MLISAACCAYYTSQYQCCWGSANYLINGSVGSTVSNLFLNIYNVSHTVLSDNTIEWWDVLARKRPAIVSVRAEYGRVFKNVAISLGQNYRWSWGVGISLMISIREWAGVETTFAFLLNELNGLILFGLVNLSLLFRIRCLELLYLIVYICLLLRFPFFSMWSLNDMISIAILCTSV